MEEAKLKTKILLKDSLRDMPVSGILIINNRQAKTAIVRTTATVLKKEGYKFDVSDKGRIDDVVVRRIK